MIKRLMYFFKINQQLEQQLSMYKHTIDALQGEVQILNAWNDSLQQEKKDLQDVIYKKFGLTKETSTEQAGNFQAVRKSKNWNDIRADLERASKKAAPDPTIAQQEEHWKNKSQGEQNKVQ